MTRDIRQDRVNKGLCPDCGKEAAPYRLCHSCRMKGVIRRCLRSGVKAGAITASKDDRDKRKVLWNLTDRNANWEFRSAYDANEVTGKSWGDGDGRTRPRLARVAVDVERELVDILRRIGRPATEYEIVAAWGQLRQERKHGTAAADMAVIIKAQDKRNRKAARRLELEAR